MDCDVLVGTWPARADIDLSPPAVQARLARVGIEGALVCSGRGAWFDDVTGNAETVEVASERPGWVPAGTINLRNALRAEEELDRLREAGVRAIRLFGLTQGCAPSFPGYRHVIDEALRREFLLLVEGDSRQIWEVFAGRSARVVFLDLHSYHLADFILLARREPGFVASSRLLNAPDSIERLTGEVGSGHLVFGSRTPLSDVSPAALRLRDARISLTEWQAVSGGTLRSLLGIHP